MKNRLHQECYARSCQEIEELKRRCCEEGNEVTRPKMNEYSLQHDQESRTVSLLRDQVRKSQERLEFSEYANIFQDPDSPSSSGSAHVSHQALVTSSSRKTSRETRMQRNRRGNKSVLRNVLIVNLHNECLRSYIMIQDIWETPPGIQRREGIEKSGSEEPLQSTLLLCFSVRAREKV